MKKLLLIISTVMVFSLFTCPISYAQEEMTESAVLTIKGVLIDSSGNPVPQQQVLVFPNGVWQIQVNDGIISNPSAKTDDQGRFTIKVERALLNKEEGFAIGTTYFGSILQQGDATVKFKVSANTPELDLGTIIFAEQTLSPQKSADDPD
jgi:hypothetical protein